MERIFRAKHHLFLLFLLHCKQAYATDESCNYVINIPEKGHLRTLYRFLWTCKHLRAHKSWTIFLLPPFWYVALASLNTWSAEYLRHFFYRAMTFFRRLSVFFFWHFWDSFFSMSRKHQNHQNLHKVWFFLVILTDWFHKCLEHAYLFIQHNPFALFMCSRFSQDLSVLKWNLYKNMLHNFQFCSKFRRFIFYFDWRKRSEKLN